MTNRILQPMRVSPHRTLACAVINQALRDATSSSVSGQVRQDARRFLTDTGRLGFWCDVAGIGLNTLRERIPRVTESHVM